jgi:3-oxoacyl-(acyl-carrier-protein) synthase
MALQAASSALKDSGLVIDSLKSKERTGVVLSSQSSQISPAVFFSDEITRRSFRALTMELVKHLSLTGPSINISKAFDFKGPCLGGGSGLSCVPFGITSILEDQADVMLVGSSSISLHPYFVHSPLLKGKNLSDGSAVLVLEDLQHALARNAKIYAEVKGFSFAFDEDRKSGVKRNLQDAVNSAGLRIEDLDLAGFEAKSDSDEKVSVKNFAFFEEFFGFMPDGLGPIEAVCILLMMKNQVVPQSLSQDKLKLFSMVKNAVATSVGLEGSISSVVFSTFNGKL